MKKHVLFTIASLISAISFAGGDSTHVQQDSLIENDFQLSFITPLGTSGTEFEQMENKISINIFAGHHGGLNGIEVGGFANSIKYNASGVQAAGFANSVQGKMEGVQAAGFVNYSGSVEGVQAAGFANATKDSLEGLQASGFANYGQKYVDGAQFSGFANTVYGNMNGIQATGFVNVVSGKIEGVQASGFCNIAKEGVDGLQASGFLNYTKRLNGAQIGFINLADSIEKGIMIGFLSFAKNGYHKWELESNESSELNIGFKTGTKSFYNILSAGATVEKEDLYWNFGYGVGSLIKLSKAAGMNIDLTVHHINKNDFTPELNMMTKLKPSFFYSFHKHLTIYGGPSLNLLVSETNIIGETPQNSNLISNPFYEKNITEGDYNLKAYFGFQAGLRF